ncbi:MAG: hypothetical protein P8R54_01235 [Myxococcota bacterium]|nr:hypothetical protein [Myxococcota bacterium]
MLSVFLACTSPAADSGASLPEIRDLAVVVPGDGLPASVVPQDANNNLDIVMHDGRMFLAFRTAPSHFASAETVLYVVSTTDEQTWRYEGEFAMNTDLREPRFLSWDGRLFLYFAELGDNIADFEPHGSWASEWKGEAAWSEPVPLMADEAGFIPWRTRTIDGVPHLIGYTGGENIYDLNGVPLSIFLLTTSDGFAWDALMTGQPVLDEGGGSEADFAILDDGRMVVVERDEAGSQLGWGSRICVAPADDWSDLQCVNDPRKYDSPLVFQQDGTVYLIGRRNLTETGHYDLGMDDLSAGEQTLQYELDYWQHPKRCSLWRVDPDALEVSLVLDLPSRGDTCFASAIRQSETEWLVYNYSSPVDGADVSWLEGQQGETFIYRMILAFPE